MKKIAVIIANRNDLQMLLVTVLSAVEELTGLNGEIVVVDNSNSDQVECIKSLLAGQIKQGNVRLFFNTYISSAAAMERAALEADAEFLFYVDSHCIIGKDTIKYCLAFFDRHKGEPIAFCYAPIQWAHNSPVARKVSFRFHRNHMGSWGKMISKEQKVIFKGMPHMIRKDVYHAIGGYGCLASEKFGWGGLIPYLGWKPWLLGYENWGIPDGVAYHFGEYPAVCREKVKYRLYGRHGRFQAGASHAVAAYVFGGEKFLNQEFEPAKMDRYFESKEAALRFVKGIPAVEKDKEWIQANQKHSIWELIENPPWGQNF